MGPGYLFAHLAADVADAALTVKALHLHVPPTQSLCNLAVLLAELLEDQLALEQVVLPLSSVLTSLS